MTDQPFAPPSVAVEAREDAVVGRSLRAARALAYAIDTGLAGGLTFAVGSVVAAVTLVVEIVVPGAVDVGFWLVGSSMLVVFVGVSVGQWIAIVEHGRSFGKWCVGLRIVSAQGDDDLGFWELVALRSWAVWWANNFSCGLAGLIDAAFVFRSDERCLHDQLAGTRVIEDSASEDRS